MEVVLWFGQRYRSVQRNPLFFGFKINAERYVYMLDDMILPKIAEHYSKGATFHQDGVPSHNTKHTRDFIADSEITEMS